MRPARKLKVVKPKQKAKQVIEKVDIAELEEKRANKYYPGTIRPLWPWIEDESVKEATCVGILEYIPGKSRGQFMDEVYRILVPGGTLLVSVMYWNSSMAYHDYQFEWPPLTEQSFLMFNRGWRESQNKKVNLNCDFDFTYGFNYDPETAARNVEVQAFQVKHYSNAATSVQLILTKK